MTDYSEMLRRVVVMTGYRCYTEAQGIDIIT